jgi:hypothetical protein
MVKRLSLLSWQWVVLLWTISTVVFLAVISVLILREPNFPLGITFVDTRRLAGLSITQKWQQQQKTQRSQNGRIPRKKRTRIHPVKIAAQ